MAGGTAVGGLLSSCALMVVRPALLLDDVFAELDVMRRRALATAAESAERVLVTAAVARGYSAGRDAGRVHRVRADDTGSMSVVLHDGFC